MIFYKFCRWEKTIYDTPKQCYYASLSNAMPFRVPTLPKIWLDLACEFSGSDLRQVVEEPELAMRVVVAAARDVHADGLRLFHFPARKVSVVGSSVVQMISSSLHYAFNLKWLETPSPSEKANK